MKQKRRYMAFEVIGAEISENYLKKTFYRLSNSMRRLSADDPMLKLVLYDAGSRRGLLRCSHKQVDVLKSEIVKICGKEPVLKILGVSGTIRSGKRKFLSS